MAGLQGVGQTFAPSGLTLPTLATVVRAPPFGMANGGHGFCANNLSDLERPVAVTRPAKAGFLSRTGILRKLS